MAFVVQRSGGSWEVREARATPSGPRSRTLAGFRELSPAVIERALARAEQPLTAEQVRVAARRAGAPVAPASADRAAAEVLRELSEGRRPRPALQRALLTALGAGEPAGRDSGAAEGAIAWLGKTSAQRGEALGELLRLVDALPVAGRRRAAPLSFPRLQSQPL